MQSQSIHYQSVFFRNGLLVLLVSLAFWFIFNPVAMAEDDGHAGNDFRQTAKEYEAKMVHLF